jgi:hypothetical protein
MSPIIKLAKSSNYEFMPRILRALYSFEIYQAVRKICRGNDAHIQIINLLHKLLGIYYDRCSSCCLMYGII